MKALVIPQRSRFSARSNTRFGWISLVTNNPELFIMAANLDGGATGQWAGTVQADILWPAASAPTNAQILTVATAMLAL